MPSFSLIFPQLISLSFYSPCHHSHSIPAFYSYLPQNIPIVSSRSLFFLSIFFSLPQVFFSRNFLSWLLRFDSLSLPSTSYFPFYPTFFSVFIDLFFHTFYLKYAVSVQSTQSFSQKIHEEAAIIRPYFACYGKAIMREENFSTKTGLQPSKFMVPFPSKSYILHTKNP